MDGVLVHSERIWFRLLNEAALRFGAGPISWEAFQPTFGQGVDADIRSFGYRCDAATLEAFFSEQFTKFVPLVEVNPDAAGLLKELGKAGLRCAVVTNSMQAIAEQVLMAAGLRSGFEVVACADVAGKPKPAPDVVIYALGKLGISAQEAVMIGDSVFDRGAAAAAGVDFIGYRLEGPARIDKLDALPRFLTTR